MNNNGLLARQLQMEIASRFYDNEVQLRIVPSNDIKCEEELRISINRDNGYNRFFVNSILEENIYKHVNIKGTKYKKIELGYGYMLIREDDILDLIIISIHTYK